jgi:hypothetical protein
MRAERRERRRRIGAVLERLGYVEWRPPPELGPLIGRIRLGRARRKFVSLLARASSRTS